MNWANKSHTDCYADEEAKRNKLRGRAKLRGKLLDEDCKLATISKNEFGPKDTRKFCYGLTDMSTEEPLQKCKECGAYAYNATPMKELVE